MTEQTKPGRSDADDMERRLRWERNNFWAFYTDERKIRIASESRLALAVGLLQTALPFIEDDGDDATHVYLAVKSFLAWALQSRSA